MLPMSRSACSIKSLISTLTLAITTVLMLSVFGLAMPTRAQDADARSILAQSLAAMGASGVTTQEIDVTVLAELLNHVQSPPSSSPLRIFTKGFDRVRWEATTDRGSIVSVSASTGAYVNTSEGKRSLRPGSAVRHGIDYLPFLRLGQLLTAQDVLLETEEVTEVDGNPAYHVTVKQIYNFDEDTNRILAHTSRMELFIDTQTYLPIRVRYFLQFNDWRLDAPVDLDFSDFRSTQGAVLPFVIKHRIDGRLLSEVRITSIDFESTLDEGLFQ